MAEAHAFPAETFALFDAPRVVVTFPGAQASWPGFKTARGTIVDFRLFDLGGRRLGYDPAGLRTAGVPEWAVRGAAESEPPGFILLASMAENDCRTQRTPDVDPLSS